MKTPTSLVAVMGMLSFATAYSNNCKGSGIYPNPVDCDAGIRTVDPNAMYTDQTQFSSGHCYIIYATNGSGDQAVSGQTIIDTFHQIASECHTNAVFDGHSAYRGSYGTNNCVKCHLTVNYRA